MPKSVSEIVPRRPKSGKARKLRFDVALAVEHLSKQDKVLRNLVKKVGACTLQLEPIDSPFHALAESIVYQQLAGKAAATIFGRVLNLFGTPQFLCPHEVLAMSDDLLRSAGLSRSKLASMKDLADKAIQGVVPSASEMHKMTNDEIIERLVSIRGIGSWTVEMMLIFRLGRPDVLPIHDYGVRKGFALAYRMDELPKPKELAAHGEKWRPYRTVASWYLWRANELPKT